MDSNWFNDMIPAFLAGTLSDADRKAFEEELARNPELQQELADTRFLKVGIDLLESLDAEHPTAGILVTYAEAPGDLDDRTRAEVEAHVRWCSECRQDIEMTRESLAVGDESRAVIERSILSRFRDWLSARLSAPVLAAVVTAMLVIAVLIGYQLPGQRETDVATYEITDAVQRGVEEEKTITIDRKAELVVFRLILPTLEGAIYTVTLLDEHGEGVLVIPNRRHALPMEIIVPTAYLSEGQYKMRVAEQLDSEATDQIPDLFELDVTIQFAK